VEAVQVEVVQDALSPVVQQQAKVGDIGQMTSKITTEKGKCYHDIQDTFNMSDEWMYFNVGYRNGNKKENLHATCFECKKVLLWDAKRK
jgi:hypothetical protein